MRLGRRRRGAAVAGAIGIVTAVALLTVTTLGVLSGDSDQQTIGTDADRPAPTTTTEARSRRTTTTTAAPDVLGDVIERESEATTSTSTPTPTPDPGGARTPVTTTAPSATAPPPTAPATTAPAPTCRNSTDPACGPLVWDPEPAPYEVEVVEVAVPLRAVVGEEVTLAVDYVERAGVDAIGACASWTVSDPGVPNVSTCEAVNHACARYGPHDPPAARDDRVRVRRTVTFTTPGEHEVRVGGHTATHLADGCANPHLASWSRTYVVRVEDAGS